MLEVRVAYRTFIGRRDCDGASVLTLTDRGRIVLRAMLPEL
jgi:hypothetical protein